MVVIPAKAGIHFCDWIAAFAGMTESGSNFGRTPYSATRHRTIRRRNRKRQDRRQNHPGGPAFGSFGVVEFARIPRCGEFWRISTTTNPTALCSINGLRQLRVPRLAALRQCPALPPAVLPAVSEHGVFWQTDASPQSARSTRRQTSRARARNS